MPIYTIPCCCPVAVDIHDLFYLNTTRFGNANHISAACQHSEMKWDRGDVSTNRALSSMHQSLTTPLKQLKIQELALFRPCLYFLLFVFCHWFVYINSSIKMVKPNGRLTATFK